MWILILVVLCLPLTQPALAAPALDVAAIETTGHGLRIAGSSDPLLRVSVVLRDADDRIRINGWARADGDGQWVMEGFEDALTAEDATRWQKADGWGNGGVFLNDWAASQIGFTDGRMRITLDQVGGALLSGEYRSVNAYGYGRYEARFRAAATAGTITGFFTYTGAADGTRHDEIDVEIKGDDPTRMQVNYWTDGVEHPTDIVLGFDASAAEHSYAFDWQPEAIRWYVDGVLVHTETGSRGPLPEVPGKLMMNFWATQGATGWSSDFDPADVPAWIEFDRVGVSMPALEDGLYHLTVSATDGSGTTNVTRELRIGVEPALFHTVTPVAGSGGVITPSTPQPVADGANIAFIVTPDDNHVIAAVTGCGGNLNGNLYTAGPITAPCTVSASFLPRLRFDDGPAPTDLVIGSGDDLAFTIGGGSGNVTVGVSRGGSPVPDAIECTPAGACLFSAPGTGVYDIVVVDTVTGEQLAFTVTVHARVSLGPDQVAAAGATVAVRFLLDAPPIAYPVVIPFIVGGSLPLELHGARSGSLSLPFGDSAELRFQIDPETALDGTILFTLETPDNAILGDPASHTVRVSARNLPPLVDIAVVQRIGAASIPTLTPVRSQGRVTVSARIADLNPADRHRHDWSGSDAVLGAPGDVAVFEFDPAPLPPGLYRLVLAVMDDGTPALTRSATRLIRVLDTCPAPQAADGCGVTDTYGQGIGGNDAEPHRLPLGGGNALTAETLSNLILRQGEAAFRAGRDGLWLDAPALAALDMGGGPGSGEVFVAAYSFEVSGLQNPGQSVPVVLPVKSGDGTPASIPPQARWLKYHPGEGWRPFVEDALNALHSADRVDGHCPPPQAAGWQAGLVAGRDCVRLTIEDGGPNDGDREDNGVVRDPSMLVGLPQGGGHVNFSASTTGCTLASPGQDGDRLLPALVLFALFGWLARRRHMGPRS